MRSGPAPNRVKAGDDYKASDQNKIVDAVDQLANLSVRSTSRGTSPGSSRVAGGVGGRAQLRGAGFGPRVRGERRPGPPMPFYTTLRRSVTSGEWIFFLDQCT